MCDGVDPVCERLHCTLNFFLCSFTEYGTRKTHNEIFSLFLSLIENHRQISFELHRHVEMRKMCCEKFKLQTLTCDRTKRPLVSFSRLRHLILLAYMQWVCVLPFSEPSQLSVHDENLICGCNIRNIDFIPSTRAHGCCCFARFSRVLWRCWNINFCSFIFIHPRDSSCCCSPHSSSLPANFDSRSTVFALFLVHR